MAAHRRWLALLVPPNFEDPLGLTARLWRSRDSAAYFAVASTLLAALATPIDLALEPAERRLYARAQPPEQPIVLVTGAPRSGTTLVAQALTQHLPVAFFNNLTAVFPRSPIVAHRIFGARLPPPQWSYRSFYGRTSGLAAQNDGLHLWDRWLGPDRYAVPTRLERETADAMRRFFGAWEQASGRPLVTKNNAVATCATLIADALPTARFIAVRREPAFAVQSILRAREVIQGSRAGRYGVGHPAWARAAAGRRPAPASAIAEICAQVLYHERKLEEQRRALGDARFRVVSYEEFCREPHRLIAAVARDVLGTPVDAERLRAALPPFAVTNRVAVNDGEFDEIQTTLARLAAPPGVRAAQQT